MNRSFQRVVVVAALAALGVALGACQRGAEAPSTTQTATPTTELTEPSGPADPEIAAAVAKVLGDAHHPQLKWPDISDVAPRLGVLYDREDDRLLWFAGDEAYPAVADAVGALGRVEQHGLDPADYDASRLAEVWARAQAGEELSPTERAHFDLALSVGVSRFIAAAHIGRVDPAALHWGYKVTPKPIEPGALMGEIRGGKSVEEVVADLEPPFSHYDRNREALARYRALAAAGEPEPVPELAKGQTKVEPGDPWAGVPRLAARLVAFGDLSAGDAAAGFGSAPDGTSLYAGALVEAVDHFQWRHGLDKDGVIGKGTLAALNVPLADRVRQIELALERERWLPAMDKRPTVFVNVALFRLWASDPGSDDEALRMNVVVGKSLHHNTPLFIEEMKYVVLRPYWNIPYSIAAHETVPKTRKDPSYLDKHQFEIVASGSETAPALPPTPENLDKVVAGTLHIRQKPGPHNALGLAKFIFPNSDNVYMHGTPAQQLFSRVRRDFSHGCIRLEDPARLGEWVLRNQPEWTREKIDAAMQGERPTRANLDESLRVVLFYVTTHVDSEGVVHFADDIYGLDETLQTALAQGYPYPRAAEGAS